jgi:uncharacterized membrane protein
VEALFLVIVLWVAMIALLALVIAYRSHERSRRVEAATRALSTRLELLERAAAGDVGAVGAAPVQEAVAPAPPRPAPPTAGERPAAEASVSTAPPSPPRPPATLEERIGVTWFTRIGAAIFILGTLYFFKYAVDNAWIGPWGRVALGVLAGVAVLFFAERVSPHARPLYVQVLLGVGLALLYVSAYAAYAFYRLAPMTVAFAALAAVAALAGALSVRHRAEAVLVVALLAALANPLLLSSRDDLALALFAYLALVAAASLLASVRMRFAATPWLALAGAAGLWLAWYGAWFNVAPAASDVVSGGTIPGTAGAYLLLERRLVPLASVLTLAALWVWFARRARALDWRRVAPAAVLLAAIVLAQWGCGAVLVDRPPLIAAALAAWAVASALLLRDAAAPAALAVPLLGSFAFLLGHAGEHQPGAEVTLLPAGAWLGVYVVTLAGRARRAGETTATTAAWAALALALTVGAVLAAVLPTPGRPWLTALALAVLAAATGVLGAAGAPAWVGAPAALIGLLGLLAGESQYVGPDRALLAAAAAWGGAYLAAGAHQLLLRRDAADVMRTLLAAGGPVGFVAIALAATRPGDAGLRALCAGLAGLSLFALGAALLRRRPQARPAATALLGAALGLISLAIGLTFSGVTVTLVWALLAATVAYLAARAHDSRWLAGAAVLFVVVLTRLLAVDAVAPARELAEFVATHGVAGRLVPPPLANPRSLALLGVAVALGVAAWSAARHRSEAGWRRAAAVAGVAAHLLVAGLLVAEARGLVTSVPAPTTGRLSEEELEQVLGRHRAAVAAQGSRRAVSATLALGGYGALLLGLGFASRSALHRWLGLAMLAATLAKLVTWDVWNVPRLYQVLVLTSVGALLLGAGFLYARFGRRLLALLKAGAVVLSALAAARPAAAIDVSHHTRRAAFDVGRAGLVAVPVPNEVYWASRADGGLADLRILSPDGREVPWVLRDEPASEPTRELAATLLDPVVLADGSARALLDVGAGEHRHNQVQLELDGREFLRRCRVETSEDRVSWGAIAEGVVYRTTAGDLPAEHTAVAYPVSAARYLRVTVTAAAGEEPVRIESASARLVPPAGAEPVTLVPLATLRREEDAREHRTLLVLDAGGAGLPLDGVLVDAPAARFSRRVVVSATNREDIWHPAGGGVLFRAGSSSGLRLAAPTARRYLRLAIDDGDDPPLEITAVRGVHRRQQLVVAATVPGRHTLYVGCGGLAAPRYDLAAVLARESVVPIAVAGVQPLEANPRLTSGAPATPPGPWSERHRAAIGLALALLLGALTAWAARSLRAG